MTDRGLRMVIVAPALCASLLASGSELQVTLSPPEQAVKRGELPRFVVTVRATTSPQLVLKFGERMDLLDNYAH